jgi:dATP pyrophosphohydrolase
MTRIATDIVDVYVFRRLNARVQFLLLQRRNDVPMARTWQAFHHEIAEGQTAPQAARAALDTLAALEVDRFYSADFINQFYDEARDAVVLAPVLAVTVRDHSTLDLADDFQEAGWFDRDEATARLPFSGQRWAVRHIDEIMGIGESESELYRFNPDATSPGESMITQPVVTGVPGAGGATPEADDELGLEPAAEADDMHHTETTEDHPFDRDDPVDDRDPATLSPTDARQD